MRLAKKSFLIGLMLLRVSSVAFGAETPGRIQFASGEMGLLNFLGMVSEKLDIQIDASGIGPQLGSVVVPDTGPLNPEQAKALVLSALYIQGYTWIYDSSTQLYSVLRQRDARDQDVPIITDSDQLPDNDLIVTYMMKIEHTPPEYIARNLRSFMPANSRIIPDDTNSSVMITDSAHNISKLKKLVQQMDTPQAAKQAKEWLAAIAKQVEASQCGPTPRGNSTPQPTLFIALFSLMALVIGFLARGYMIRRIEGGL